MEYLTAQNDSLTLAGVELLPDSGAILMFYNYPQAPSPDTVSLSFTRVDKEDIPQLTHSYSEDNTDKVRIWQHLYSAAGELVILGKRQAPDTAHTFLMYVNPQTLEIEGLHEISGAIAFVGIGGMTETMSGDIMLYGSRFDDTTTTYQQIYPTLLRIDRQGTLFSTVPTGIPSISSAML